MSSRPLWWPVGLLLLSGCCGALPDHTGAVADQLAARVRDVEPPPPAEQAPAPTPVESRPRLSLETDSGKDAPDLTGTAAQIDKTPPTPALKPFAIPPELPGANAPPINLPPEEPARKRYLDELYPPLPPLSPELRPASGPGGRPLTLADLQSLATANNPAIRNAVAAVDAARGALVQAGAYPNPSVFWEADTVMTGKAGYQGAGIDQPFKGANKIKLQKAMAEMDLKNAEVALRRAQSDLATQVRSNYFAVLVALENMKVSRALARFTEEIFRAQVTIAKAGAAAAAPYEPMLLRPLVLQARFNLAQAENQYQASWKQLAAALGLPNFPPTELAGRVDLPVPVFHYDEVRARVLRNHTDVVTAENSLQRARYALELARLTPFPDCDVHFLVQKDYTAPPFLMGYSAIFTVPVPVWDQNRGGIIQAESQLIQANLQPRQTQLQLINTLADAYNRYATAREQVRISTAQIQDQVRAYRALRARYNAQPAQVAFADIYTAQQTLAGYTSAYIIALGAQWTAVVDVANLLQTDDLFGLGPSEPVVPVPDLEHLPPPCGPSAGPPARGLPAATPVAAADRRDDAGPEPVARPRFAVSPPALVPQGSGSLGPPQ